MSQYIWLPVCPPQVQSVTVIPHADNPLPRYAVEQALYQQAVRAGVTQDSGAALADRQYQVDVRGLTLATGETDVVAANEAWREKNNICFPHV